MLDEASKMFILAFGVAIAVTFLIILSAYIWDKISNRERKQVDVLKIGDIVRFKRKTTCLVANSEISSTVDKRQTDVFVTMEKRPVPMHPDARRAIGDLPIFWQLKNFEDDYGPFVIRDMKMWCGLRIFQLREWGRPADVYVAGVEEDSLESINEIDPTY